MTASIRRRISASVATAVLTTLALSGCVTSFFPGQTPDSSEPAFSTPYPQDVSEDLASYYQQQLVWYSCDEGQQCSSVQVPSDWSDPGGASISLSVIRSLATGERQGSLLTNPGGPGASGIALVRDSLDFVFGERLRENYDIVGFDPRGVGESAPVECLDGTDMDAYLYGIPTAERGSDEWIAETKLSSKRFARACAANSSVTLDDITTEAAARDMDVLRAVLGDSHLNYLGFSYGTFLGATYAGLFPERVGRLVLDGAVNPAASSAEVTQAQIVGFEGALDAYLTDCLATDGCPFTGDLESARKRVGALLDQVDASPLQADDGRELGGSTLVTAIIYPLYSQDAWPQLSEMLAATMAGDPEPAFQFADLYNHRSDGFGEYLENTTEAFTAYNCADYPVTTDAAELAAEADELTKAAPLIGPYMTYGDLGCEPWPIATHAEREPITAEGAAPILVIGTSNDPATPYAWAVAMAEQLASGVLVSYEGEGHTAYNRGSACINNTVEDFLVDGVVPDKDPRC
ncbi:MAG: alpha/beta hydrolase [Mycetocola sp.]